MTKRQIIGYLARAAFEGFINGLLMVAALFYSFLVTVWVLVKLGVVS